MEVILCVHSETENHSHIQIFSHDLRLHGTERLWCVTRIVTRIQIVGFESTHHCGSGRHIIQLMQKRMTLVIHMSKSTNMIFDILTKLQQRYWSIIYSFIYFLIKCFHKIDIIKKY